MIARILSRLSARSRLQVAVGWMLVLALGQPVAAAPETEIAAGDLRVVFTAYDGVNAARGVRLFWRDTPLTTRSSVNVVAPGWRETFFGLGRSPGDVAVSDVPEGKRLTFQAANDAFELAYVVEVLSGNRAVLEVSGTLRKDVRAVMEYAAGYLSAVALAGQPYEALTANGPLAGRLPFAATSAELSAAMVTPPLRRLQIRSRFGTLLIEGPSEGPGLDFFDARKMPTAWFREHPVFWLGYSTAPLKPGQTFRSRITVQFLPLDAAARPERPVPRVVSLPTRDVPDARLPAPPDGQIIPEPQERTPGKGEFRITARTRIVDDGTAAARRAARELQERLQDAHGVRVPRAPAAILPERRDVIVIGTLGSPTMRRWLSETRARPVSRPEGYLLQVAPRHVLLAAADARGVLYGVFSLLQMARAGAQENGSASGALPHSHTPTLPHTHTPLPPHPPAFPAATIRDWPALPVRGVHLLADHWSGFLHRKLIRGILAPHKINTILLECQYVKWDSHPELHVPWGMEKEEVRALLALARDYHIEVIPLVETLGHVRWMFENDQHLDLAEDPEARFAYCPSNPKTYDLVFDVLEEAVDLFGRPRFFHIGHDEFLNRGRFAAEGPCKGKAITDLFVADTLKLRDFLAQRGARTLIWGDVLLGPKEAADATHAPSLAEARQLRERLPKDILITDWHYIPAASYPSLGILRDAGFEVWAATWQRPENIHGFARAAAERGSGLIQTTWTGYYGNRTALRREFPQFAAYVLAAGYAWRPDGPPPETASPAARRRFRDAWPGFVGTPRAAPGFTLDLGPVANLPWRDTSDRDGWLGYGPEHDLSALAPGAHRLGDTLFHLPEAGRAVAVSGTLLPFHYPETATVPVGRRAGQLALLMAAGWAVAENRTVGWVTVRYADGTELPVELLYGWNIRAAHDARSAFLAPVAWEGRTTGGETLHLGALTLGNPFPDKVIAAIELRSAGTEAAPILFAVSGVE
ncbi:MAG: family 20 glycosylhydrolase [Armatimonadetes bacterium]|nr:family 20 glycosylhydrolase [Armatimonadota bacterium]